MNHTLIEYIELSRTLSVLIHSILEVKTSEDEIADHVATARSTWAKIVKLLGESTNQLDMPRIVLGHDSASPARVENCQVCHRTIRVTPA